MAHPVVRPAAEADLSSLSTVVARAFHPSNEYFRQTLSDTPLMQQWWYDLLRDAIRDPIYHVLAVADDSSASPASHATGLLLLRRIESDGSGESAFDRHPPTADHDQARYAAMLSGSKGGPRERFLMGQRHFSLDLFGVDAGYQGTGLSKELLLKACEISNAEHADIFVQANTFARAFYEKRGFECVEEVTLPGPEKYGEVFMVFRAEKTT